MSADQYRSDPQQRILRAVAVLAERPLAGMGVDDLAERLEGSRDQAFRTLTNLELAGWAERTDGGWRLTPRATQISERMRLAIADLHRSYLGGLA